MKRAIAFSGLLVGTLDGLDAVILTLVYGGSPFRMFQSIGGGLIGREAALSGGAPTVVLGILCHYFIATTVSAIYIAASRKIALLTARPLICGALYGLIVLAVMRNVVIPLSALGPPRQPLSGFGLVNQLFAHICLVGIPAALVARAAR